MADRICSRGHRVDRDAVLPGTGSRGPHEAANVYLYRNGVRACLECTRAQWRRQWARKAAHAAVGIRGAA